MSDDDQDVNIYYIWLCAERFKHMNSLVLLCLLLWYKLDDCALSTAMVVWLSGTIMHAIDLHIHTLVAIL